MSEVPNGPRRQLPLDEAGARLPALVRDIAARGPIELTDEGQPVAVIVAPDEYRRLAGDRPDTWDAYQKFRAEVDLEELGIDESFLDGLRDRSPGHEIDL